MSTLLEQVEIDFLLLADKAEILNGKLYMMGGAWDRIHLKETEVEGGIPVPLSIVVGVLVPWHLTNESHQIHLSVHDEDGNLISPQGDASVKVGRPLEATRGQKFRVMAVFSNVWTLPRPGAYSVAASFSNGNGKEASFYAVPS